MTGVRIGRLVEGVCNLVFSLIIALIYGWKLALVMLLSFPLLALGAFLEFTLLQTDGSSMFSSEGEEEALTIATESVQSIRTISSLTLGKPTNTSCRDLQIIQDGEGLKSSTPPLPPYIPHGSLDN